MRKGKSPPRSQANLAAVDRLCAERGSAWRDLYEAGEGLHGIKCIEGGRGHAVSEAVIVRGIVANGGTIRTKAEALAKREEIRRNKRLTR